MKKCPHCGGTQFKAAIKRPGVIRMNEDGSVTVVKELDKFAYEVVECLKCKEKVTNEQLSDDIKCAQCGNAVKPEDAIDGLCPVCYAMKNRPDLASASQEDLIRRLLEMEKQLQTKTAGKVEKKVEEAAQTVANVQEKVEKAEQKAKEEENATAEDEEAKKRSEAAKKAAETRKANAEKKKAEEEAAKAAVEAQAQPEPATESAPTTNPMGDVDLPMGDEAGIGLGIVPPEMSMEDPF